MRREWPGENRDARRSKAGLSRAADAIFEARHLLDADRATRMELAGGDADLGAEAEFAAIGELRRGVVQNDRRIDLGEESRGRLVVAGEDAVGMLRAVLADVVHRAVDTVDHARRDDRVEIFSVPV